MNVKDAKYTFSLIQNGANQGERKNTADFLKSNLGYGIRQNITLKEGDGCRDN